MALRMVVSVIMKVSRKMNPQLEGRPSEIFGTEAEATVWLEATLQKRAAS
jgi:hypothetical protein